MCEYCDGASNPTIMGAPLRPKLLFCIRGRTLVIRVLKREWFFSQWLLTVNFCPVCGRDLRRGNDG